MTVAELIKELQALPQDIQVMMLDSDRESPVEIVQVSRGSWADDLADDEDIEDGFESMIDPEEAEFIQDDENGKIAVLVVW
jgi:predicted house-cleaning noncanonical NTP pyrophosphatase (MazG superfamily)